MAQVVLTADHYYPGANIPTPQSAEGAVCDWNNAFVRSLPPGPNPAWQGPGWDPNRPAGWQTNGAQDVCFNIVGEGKSVDFVAWSDRFHGVTMTLWAPDHDEEKQAGPNGTTLPWVAYGGDSSQHSDDPYIPRAAIRRVLTAGVTYILEIGSGTYDASAPYGTGFDADFHFETYYTPEKLNDTRANANDVIIWDDGMTYHGVPMLNANYTHVFSAADDPASDPYIYFTGWWRYEPTKSGNVDIDFAIIPQGADWFVMNVWKSTGDGPLTKIANISSAIGTSTGSVTVSISEGEICWVQIGSASSYNLSHALSQSYQLQVSGSKSKVQLPDPPPDGDGGDGGGGSSGDEDADLPTPGASNPSNPTAPVPGKTVADGEKTCSTILDLVREFQRVTKTVVRIEGASEISIVDPNEPLPSGFVNGRGARYYSTTELDLASDSKVLRLSRGYMDLLGSAHLVTDDVGLIVSGWRIPQRLPFPNLDPAPVSRVSYTFTPKTFTADVEFAFPDVPLKVRRTS